MSEDKLRQTNLRRRYDTDLRNEFERNADAIEEIRKDLQRIYRDIAEIKGEQQRVAALSVPRILTNGNGITLAGGTLTIDCMGAADVIARVTLSAEVTSIVIQNAPERCGIYWEFRQSGGPHAMLQAAWPSGTVFETDYNVFTDSTVSRFWWVTSNGGTDAFCECNAPTSAAMSTK